MIKEENRMKVKSALKLFVLTFSLNLWLSLGLGLHAQHYTRTDTIPVYANGDTLKFPWAGGHNYSQFSDIDLNFDGIKDLFVFDRTGNKITTYINGGTPNTVDYTHEPQYQDSFPSLQYWVLLADYDCDGKEDIFTSSVFPSGIRVYKNTSTPPNNLQFTLVQTALQDITGAFIPANNIGLPVIEDIDNDGDLDILTFVTGNMTMDYYINQRVELGYNCDSLVFKLDLPCWGHFSEVGNLCTVVLTSCRIGQWEEGTEDGGRKTEETSVISRQSSVVSRSDNGSSCSLCMDMDADGDKELLIGQGNCCTMTLLTNGGTPSSANMTSFTSNFPDSIIPINIRSNPCGYFVDVNNDSKRDLLVSPSLQNVSVNNESIWHYENTGADNSPVFSRQTRSFLQQDMIDVGAGADPVFFDFDSDGLTDLLISNYIMSYDSCVPAYSYGVFAYKNIGTASSPKFNLVNTDYANLSSALSGLTSKHLTFGNVDNDLDEDMFVGDYDGKIHYFENTGNSGPADFSTPPVVNYPDNTGSFIDIGNNATPQLMDADRDGDLDLIIGERAGNINYYRNIGTQTTPSYSLVTSSFGGVDVMVNCCTGYSVPFMYDSAGANISYNMIVGSEANRASGAATGWLWYYKNIDGNLSGNFNPVDSMYQNSWEGTHMTVNGKDITNDGRMDLVIGNYGGGVAFYMGDTLTTGIAEMGNDDFDFTIYPNPSSGKFNLSMSQFEDLKMKGIEIYNIYGEKVAVNFQINSSSNFQIDLSAANGIYFCKVRGENFSKTKKIVVLK